MKTGISGCFYTDLRDGEHLVQVVKCVDEEEEKSERVKSK